MLRTLIDCSRLALESPWLMLLAVIVLIVPGGLLLMPIPAPRLRRTKRDVTMPKLAIAESNVTNRADASGRRATKSDLTLFAPSAGTFN